MCRAGLSPDGRSVSTPAEVGAGGATVGNAGVGIMRGPGLVNFDFTLAKNFNLSERHFPVIILVF